MNLKLNCLFSCYLHRSFFILGPIGYPGEKGEPGNDGLPGFDGVKGEMGKHILLS